MNHDQIHVTEVVVFAVEEMIHDTKEPNALLLIEYMAVYSMLSTPQLEPERGREWSILGSTQRRDCTELVVETTSVGLNDDPVLQEVFSIVVDINQNKHPDIVTDQAHVAKNAAYLQCHGNVKTLSRQCPNIVKG
jgi:hypothetical protein